MSEPQTITVNDAFDPNQWEPYDCVVQVDHSGNKIKWQDYATIKNHDDQTGALALILLGCTASFRVKQEKNGVVTYYIR